MFNTFFPAHIYPDFCQIRKYPNALCNTLLYKAQVNSRGVAKIFLEVRTFFQIQ